MLFSTPLFLYVFFPFFFLGYFLTPRRHKNAFALFGSIVFYAWGEPLFVFLVILALLTDFYLGNKIAQYRQSEPPKAKFFMTLGVTLNLSLLGYFKYTNFFLKTFFFILNPIHPVDFKPLDILLPLGISFFIFEEITYLVDLYRGVGHPAKKFINYAAYIFLFPKLLAGPIIKYHDIEDQLENRDSTWDDIAWGLRRFILGLAKKVLFADTFSLISDKAFAIHPNELDVSTAWIGVAYFTLQVYFDFSGYSDMAIGMARMMGFNLRENFSNPFLADSTTDFWRRWHISLATWIKSYLFIPLGGSRVPPLRAYFNLLLCFFLCGLWHGAQWTFVLWGLYEGLFLMLDKLFWLKLSERLPRDLNRAITFFIFMFGVVIFRSSSITGAFHYYLRLFSITLPTAISAQRVFILSHSDLFLFGAGICWILFPRVTEKNLDNPPETLPTEPVQPLAAIGLVLLLLLCLVKISSSSFNPFIYFRF